MKDQAADNEGSESKYLNEQTSIYDVLTNFGVVWVC